METKKFLQHTDRGLMSAMSLLVDYLLDENIEEEQSHIEILVSFLSDTQNSFISDAINTSVAWLDNQMKYQDEITQQKYEQVVTDFIVYCLKNGRATIQLNEKDNPDEVVNGKGA